MNKFLPAILFFCILSLSSCSIWEQLGSATIISNKTIDLNKKYCLLKAFAGSAKNELKKNASPVNNIDEAINNLLKDVPGGLFLMNARIVYGVYGVSITGDVYGLCDNSSDDNLLTSQFKIGDYILWENNGSYLKGSIESQKDDDEFIIRTEDGNFHKVKSNTLLKALPYTNTK